jgi:muramoyltetrapeptide carboxypeptidase
MQVPKSLIIGDQVAIIATAKTLEQEVQLALETIQSWGLTPVLGEFTLEQYGYFAGTDAQKLADIDWAFHNDDIKAIIFLRGGYGTTRIIDKIDFQPIIDRPKWMVGYSDLTALILQMDKLNLPMIHGPMCSTLGNHPASDEVLKGLLFGQRNSSYSCKGQHLGKAKGRIVGGNLSMVYESLGAANEIQTDNAILFLEEVGEEMYGIDRMMNKLKRIGKLEGINGLILGSFTSISNTKSYFHQSVEELIMGYMDHQMPIAFDLNAGHAEENLSLIMNSPCQIAISGNKIEIQYSDQKSSNEAE